MLRVVPSVKFSPQLKAVSLALRLMDKDLRREINKATRDTMNPEWTKLVKSAAVSPGEQAVLVPGARVAAGNPPAARAAASVRKLSGGALPTELANAMEFGTSDREKVTTYDRRNRKTGGSHKVTRHTRRQLPVRRPKGYVVYPSFAKLAPRMASLWTQIVVKKTHEAFEKGS